MLEDNKVIAVIGAGTSGSAAAIRLRQLGYKVVLIERSNTTALQIGESVPGAIIRMLQTLGFNSMDDLLSGDEFRVCPAVSSSWGDDEWYYKDGFTNPEGGGWQVLRHQFDANLRKQALALGCEWLNASFEQLDESPEGFTLHLRKLDGSRTAINAKLIVDSSGRNSKIINQLKIEKKSSAEQAAVYSWARVPNDEMQASRVKTVKNGWWYTSLLPGDLRVVSFHGLLQDIRAYQRDPAGFLAAFNEAKLLNQEILPDHLQSSIQACDASTSLSTQVFGKNWIAVGDAALSFDPISAQGIFFALYSAIRGAEALVSSDQTLLTNYRTQIEQIATTNNAMRMRYYTSELRYMNESYWKQYFI